MSLDLHVLISSFCWVFSTNLPATSQCAEVKLLPVTRALEASGACHSILSSLPDALEATEKNRRVGEDQPHGEEEI